MELLCLCLCCKAEESWFLCQQKNGSCMNSLTRHGNKHCEGTQSQMRCQHQMSHSSVSLWLSKSQLPLWVSWIFLAVYPNDTFSMENTLTCFFFLLLINIIFNAEAILIFKSSVVPSKYICWQNWPQSIWTLLLAYS